MTFRFLRLNGMTRSNRHAVIDRAKEAILAAGGWIMDFTLLSNALATLRFEVPDTGLWVLHAGLEAAGITLDADSRAALAAPPRGTDDLKGAVQVTFIHNEPDLRREIPAVPG
ncbi:hypothetical protein [Azospirillum sp.]|uniref:hypothetical protein n=1 Tax=Azospirillum sp. TaxID=34012 RepID=UPI002D4026CC|nr:hypothetical protein [Azospirillum sp.]HYD67620.1 hypothetical protein [Azospirillum sp.]